MMRAGRRSTNISEIPRRVKATHVYLEHGLGWFVAEVTATAGLRLTVHHHVVPFPKCRLDILSDKGRLTKTGWTTTITLEAHAVNIRDAAASGE
jgi:hypothetical protein